MGKKKNKAKKKEEKKAKKARKKEKEKNSSPLEKSPKEAKNYSEINEDNKKNESHSEVTKPSSLPDLEKEKKGSMNLSITPTNKKKLKDMAQSVNMSASELIAYWINNHNQEE